jgi:RAC serine/threonine-protein kinase
MPLEGWATKEGGSFKSLKKRWFHLDGANLCYAKAKGEKDLGQINIKNAGVIQESTRRKNKAGTYWFEIPTPSRTYFVATETEAERKQWMEALSAAHRQLNPERYKGDDKVTPDDFEVLKLIGQGSFGRVLQVRKKNTGEIYAMKVLEKAKIIAQGEEKHTMAERNILTKLKHPFLVNLNYAFQTNEQLHFVLDFVNGGELFFHLQNERRFSEERVRFNASEILLALEHLHNAGVIYRDLKPENLLLTDQGHIVMTDFGLAKEGMFSYDAKTDTFCGTPEYLAPEVLLGNGYGKAVDWWSFGCLVYEMLSGLPPFYSQNVQDMYKRILSDKLIFAKEVSPEAKELITALLTKDPERRVADPNVLKRYKFFEAIDWDALYNKKIPPPFVPQVSGKNDISMIDPSFTEQRATLSAGSDDPPLTASQQKTAEFENFTFVKPPTN